MPFAIPLLIAAVAGAVGIIVGRGSKDQAAPVAPATSVVPPGPLDSSGRAAQASDEAAQQLQKAHATLEDLDKRLGDLEKSTDEAHGAVKKELDSVKNDLDAKIAEIGDRIKTPEGQKEFRDFYIQRLEKAKSTLEAADADANSKAKDARALVDDYLKLAGERPTGTGSSTRTVGNGDEHGSGGGGGHEGGGGGGTEAGATPPAGTTQPASATGMQPAGMPLGMPGGFGMPSMGGMPGFGGGAPAGGGGGIPGLSDGLGGLSGIPRTEQASLSDGTEHGGGDHPKNPDITNPPGQTNPAGTTGTTEGNTTGSDHTPKVNAETGGTGAGLSISLPDGTHTQAASTAAAAAVRSAIDGTPVDTAWQQAGVTLPPAGTPILDPIPPGDLKAGDVGYFKDHLVMALGSNKFLVNGQVQPETSLSSGPDFLGWMRPGAATAGGDHAAPPATPPATPPTGTGKA